MTFEPLNFRCFLLSELNLNLTPKWGLNPGVWFPERFLPTMKCSSGCCVSLCRPNLHQVRKAAAEAEPKQAESRIPERHLGDRWHHRESKWVSRTIRGLEVSLLSSC